MAGLVLPCHFLQVLFIECPTLPPHKKIFCNIKGATRSERCHLEMGGDRSCYEEKQYNAIVHRLLRCQIAELHQELAETMEELKCAKAMIAELQEKVSNYMMLPAKCPGAPKKKRTKRSKSVPLEPIEFIDLTKSDDEESVRVE